MAVAIIGSGIVGATLALALSYLSQGKMQIHLVEKQDLDSNNHPAFQTRGIALTYSTCHALNTIGVWQVFAPHATLINRVEVSERSNINKLNISASDYYLPALGYVIEPQDIGKKLFKLLCQSPGIHLHCPTKLNYIRRERTHTTITLNNGESFNAQLVVAADGSQSSIATLCGIHWQEKNYNQIAVIANLSTLLPHKGDSFERFTLYGPLAMLPISGERSASIWCIPTKLYTEISRWDEKQFCQALQLAFGWRLGRITAASHRGYYPLRLKIANRHIMHRLALVGNAAQTLHPIAGQSLNLGLRDVMTLAKILVYNTVQGKDIGHYSTLLHYQQCRRLDQASTINITDGLVRLFSNCHFPLVLGRNLGLLAMANLPPLRDMLVRKILGWIS